MTVQALIKALKSIFTAAKLADVKDGKIPLLHDTRANFNLWTHVEEAFMKYELPDPWDEYGVTKVRPH